MPFDLLAFNPAPTPAIAAYGDYLVGRLNKAVAVPKVEVSLGAWTPQPNQCHENCNHYAEHSGSGHLVASGWLVMDQRATLGHIRFFAHSVMAPSESPETWYDITPGETEGQYPILFSNLSPTAFMQFDHVLSATCDASIFDVRP